MIDHIEDTLSARLMKVVLLKTKTQVKRFFYFDNQNYDIVKKYYNLRPIGCSTRQFLINFQKGKCTKQPVGENKIAAMPKKIAMFLNLAEPDTYKGHSLS